MKSTGRVCSPARAGFFALTLVVAIGLGAARAQNEPILVPDAVAYQKLLPICPSLRGVGLPISRRARLKMSADSGSQTCTATTERAKEKRRRTLRLASSIQFRTLIMSALRPKRGRATATPAKVTKSVNIDGKRGFETFEKTPSALLCG